jgi:hypothetical protein
MRFGLRLGDSASALSAHLGRGGSCTDGTSHHDGARSARGYVECFGSHALQMPGEETPDERRYLVKRGLK